MFDLLKIVTPSVSADSRDNFVKTLDTITKIVFVLAPLVYVFGFLTCNFDLAHQGFAGNSEALRAEYFFVGIVFLLITAANIALGLYLYTAVAICVGLLKYVRKLWKEERGKKSRWPLGSALKRLIAALIFGMIALGSLSSVEELKPHVTRMDVGYSFFLALLLAYGVSFPGTFDQLTGSSISSGFTPGDLAYGLPLTPFFAYGIVCILVTFVSRALKVFSSAGRIAYVSLWALVLVPAGLIMAYTSTIYPKLSPALYGGEPFYVRLFPKTEAGSPPVPISSQTTYRVLMRNEVSIFVEDPTAHTISEVPLNQVETITYLGTKAPAAPPPKAK